MTLPAARVGDKIMCPVPQATPAAAPHAPAGMPIIPPGCPTVLIGGAPAARVTDKSICVTPAPGPNPVLTGAFTVTIGGLPAARMTDPGTHPGSMILPPCCPTVLIGTSGTAGNVAVGKKMAAVAAKGRKGGSTQQSYNNCGVESARQIIAQSTGQFVDEETLLDRAMSAGQASTGPTRASSGGTSASSRQEILQDNGVDSSVQDATPENLSLALAKGNGVIVNADAGKLWNDPSAAGGGHAVTVVGMEYDDKGKPSSVIINDTGTGTSAHKVPAKQFFDAVNGHPSGSPKLNVTDKPIF